MDKKDTGKLRNKHFLEVSNRSGELLKNSIYIFYDKKVNLYKPFSL